MKSDKSPNASPETKCLLSDVTAAWICFSSHACQVYVFSDLSANVRCAPDLLTDPWRMTHLCTEDLFLLACQNFEVKSSPSPHTHTPVSTWLPRLFPNPGSVGGASTCMFWVFVFLSWWQESCSTKSIIFEIKMLQAEHRRVCSRTDNQWTPASRSKQTLQSGQVD